MDLFAGPGGLDVAAEKLELSVLGIELDPHACATRRANELCTIESDVREVDRGLLPSARVLAGGPPCQTYTVAGKGAGRRALNRVLDGVKLLDDARGLRFGRDHFGDERTGLVLEPLAWALAAIDEGRPYEAIVLEQVPAVLPVWEAMSAVLEKRDYFVDCKVLRSEEYGVPQTRRRAILIARRDGEVKFPRPTHRHYRKGIGRDEGDQDLRRWVCMSDVLPERSTPFEVVSNYGSGGNPKARGRRRHDQPSATVTGKISRNRVLGPGSCDTRFSDQESGMLQTFPSDYQWAGRNVAQQIGNAIPPVLAAHVLAAALGLDHERLTKAVKELYGGDLPA